MTTTPPAEQRAIRPHPVGRMEALGVLDVTRVDRAADEARAREVLAEHILAKPWGGSDYDDGFWSSVRITGPEAIAAMFAFATRAAGEEYRRGLEDAAKVADDAVSAAAAVQAAIELHGGDASPTAIRRKAGEAIATAIRALAPGEAGA